MQATLRGRGVWRLVSKKEKHHLLNPEKQEEWDDKADRPCSILTLGVEQSQRVHFQTVKDNPIKIWKALKSAHVHKQPGTRFNVYNNFFSIRKEENKSLQALMACIDESMHKMQNLCPNNFDLQKLDEELTCMAMIHALPEDYANFMSSILLLGSLDKSMLQDAFHAEEMNCRCCAAPTMPIETDSVSFVAPRTKPKECSCGNNPVCVFCEKLGHCIHIFRTIAYLNDQRKECQNKGQNNMNKTKETMTNDTATTEKSTEFAGRASQNQFTPLMNNADQDWNADTGASAHMTPLSRLVM